MRNILMMAMLFVAFTTLLPAFMPATSAADVRLVSRRPDPHGSPRPARDARHVPLKTSLYFEIETSSDDAADGVDPHSVAVTIRSDDGESLELLQPGQRFVGKSHGWLKPRQVAQGANKRSVRLLAVYIEPGESLRPQTRYTVQVAARSRRGGELPEASGTWSFTTEARPSMEKVEFTVDLADDPVHWRGHFFSGLCNVVFCTDAEIFGPTYEMMHKARQRHPRAWTYQRDFWPTGMEHGRPSMHVLPNVVRERETRRISAIESHARGALLHVEDFFGHEQYGIPSGRAISNDYHPGDEVLIADGVSDARTKVLSVDDDNNTVLVEPFSTPEGGWKIDYLAPLPTQENPDAPGLFPPGGCYLRKFAPHGTPVYYWGRLDKEWDLVHGRYGRRIMVNFADAAGDLSRDGRNWTTAKDYAQWHRAVRDITGHLIDRYGDAALDFTWSVFNEPDLGVLFWRADWQELQTFYDYTVDGILRAFEDRGYDSDQVFIGGLELGGIFGTNLRLREFLAHCSPHAEAEGALPLNAAFADARLDGQRSRRVEALCRAHDGKGSPCDFISIHAYNNSAMMAAKLKRAKELALEIDADYYKTLWVNSHESCPEWNLPPDEAAADAYLGNGYFSSWCLDVVGRQLRQAATDSRYAFGETLLTVWPPTQNFGGLNAISRIVHIDDDGDGQGDRKVTLPNLVFHVLNHLSDLGDHYWVLPEATVGGHSVAGFASRDGDALRVLLYTHHGEDTQSRSEAAFDVTLTLSGLPWDGKAKLTEYRFDREHNSYFQAVKELVRRSTQLPPADREQIAKQLAALRSDDRAARQDALKKLPTLGPAALREALPAAIEIALEAKDDQLRADIEELVRAIFLGGAAVEAFPADDVERIQQLAVARATAESLVPRDANGTLRVTVRLAGNGANVLILEPDHESGEDGRR